jgi:hypothetical protein
MDVSQSSATAAFFGESRFPELAVSRSFLNFSQKKQVPGPFLCRLRSRLLFDEGSIFTVLTANLHMRPQGCVPEVR